VASRRAQKDAARQAREQAVAQIKAQQAFRTRLLMLGGVLAVVIAAVVVVIVVSSSGGGGSVKDVNDQQDGAQYSHAVAQARVASLLQGIPQSGSVLGSPIAPVTITEFGDLVCPICDAYAIDTEPDLILSDVRTGEVKLLWRADDTASGYANEAMFDTTQTAILSAGLQDKAWNFIMLTYYEQPATIGGQDAERVPYVTPSYLANRAQQIPGLKLAPWQANLQNPVFVAKVKSDVRAANTEAPRGTPTLIVQGPKGSVTYDANGELAAVPSVGQLQQLIAQVK
jgi:hypothetical protein